ncbi:MAG TPA: endonuclease domain-containing protein [Chitinophagaceae bacterium]
MGNQRDNLSEGATPGIFEHARGLRKNMTNAEKILWQQLKNRKLEGLKFRRQHPIGTYIPDFFCHEHKLTIEVDGSIHDREEVKTKDHWRTRDLSFQHVRVLRFTNEEVEKNIEQVLKTILEFVKENGLAVS